METKTSNIAASQETIEVTSISKRQLEVKASGCDHSNHDETKQTKKEVKKKKKPSRTNKPSTEKPVKTISETKDAPALACNNVAEADKTPSPERKREKRSRRRIPKVDVSVHSK